MQCSVKTGHKMDHAFLLFTYKDSCQFYAQFDAIKRRTKEKNKYCLVWCNHVYTVAHKSNRTLTTEHFDKRIVRIIQNSNERQLSQKPSNIWEQSENVPTSYKTLIGGLASYARWRSTTPATRREFESPYWWILYEKDGKTKNSLKSNKQQESSLPLRVL